MSVAVEATGVAKRYGSLVAVSDLTFAVEEGEVVGVLGPNGAGKTTAMRMLTTILEPSEGGFSVGGVPHTRPAEIRRQIGVVPESAGYPDRQTGEEFLRYHARLFGQRRAAARATADALLSAVGLGDRRRSLIATYSRGMRQRLGIARALVNEPTVVFLDEPTLGLDPAGQRQVLGLVRGIQARGATVLLSSHLLEEVAEVCSRVMILNHGRVVADGTVSEVSRRAAAPRSGQLHVPAEHTEWVCALLADAPGVARVSRADGRRGWLDVVFDATNGGVVSGANEALLRVIEAGVPLLFFELEGARLSDAFLAMTEAS